MELVLINLVAKWLRNHSVWKHKVNVKFDDDLRTGKLSLLYGSDRSEVFVRSDHIYYIELPRYRIDATDPLFFTKLDRILQFSNTRSKRHQRFEEEFRHQEEILFAEMLKIKLK